MTIPSQIRYVYYYEDYLRTKRGGTAVPLLLERVNMSTTPKIGGSYQMPPFRLLEDNEGIFTSVVSQCLLWDGGTTFCTTLTNFVDRTLK